ncbi:MAG: hypothetical protein FJ271_11080 [Planctomycetes bacterium]|nr:hypothetical protein [Planctomycetota bacterium]
MVRYLGLAAVLVSLGMLGRAAVQGQDDKKEPEIILKKKVRKDDPKNNDPKNDLKVKDTGKDKEPEPKRELPKIDDLPSDEPEGENPAKIVERIRKNLSTTDERLDKKDPGDETRKLQDKIVKDLDELIKQKQNQDDKNQSSSSSSSSGSSKSSSSKSSGSKSSKSSSSKSASGNKDDKQPKGGNGEKPEPMGSGKQPKNPMGGQGTAGKGKDPKQQTGNGKDNSGKNAKNDGNGGKGGDGNDKKKSTVADLYPDIWGHLPQTKRLEMDAYSRERFMPRYEELLRQYYRTIAEQTRRKEGE